MHLLNFSLDQLSEHARLNDELRYLKTAESIAVLAIVIRGNTIKNQYLADN
jgi:hypothetical protein